MFSLNAHFINMQLISSLTFLICLLVFPFLSAQDFQQDFDVTYQDQKPLIILDGKIWDNHRQNPSSPFLEDKMSPFTEINPDDIEQVIVLKGQEAISLYGTLAQNGVIIINRKKKWMRNKP